SIAVDIKPTPINNPPRKGCLPLVMVAACTPQHVSDEPTSTAGITQITLTVCPFIGETSLLH
ncbi:MAG: hypothetical protein ACKOEH_01885, partial [Actinomycetota bacterium]